MRWEISSSSEIFCLCVAVSSVKISSMIVFLQHCTKRLRPLPRLGVAEKPLNNGDRYSIVSLRLEAKSRRYIDDIPMQVGESHVVNRAAWSSDRFTTA